MCYEHSTDKVSPNIYLPRNPPPSESKAVRQEPSPALATQFLEITGYMLDGDWPETYTPRSSW
jgi:hypothetical protein